MKFLTNSLLFAASFIMLTYGIVTAEDLSGDWKKTLLTELKAHYEITTRNWLGKIQKPGTVLIVVQDGIQADKPNALMKPTIIQDGKITKSGGGDIIAGWGARSLKRGEKVYVYDIRVKDDYVLFLIATVTTIDVVEKGGTKATVQESAVSFRLDKKTSPTPESVIAMIKPWFTTESEEASQNTIALGQTISEVEKKLGQPTKIAKLNPKVIYFYKDMKVTFVDGKVTDVQ